jgi:hypothetical protein
MNDTEQTREHLWHRAVRLSPSHLWVGLVCGALGIALGTLGTLQTANPSTPGIQCSTLATCEACPAVQEKKPDTLSILEKRPSNATQAFRVFGTRR